MSDKELVTELKHQIADLTQEKKDVIKLCEEKDLNLNLIIELKRKFRCKIGYSGHETSVSPSIAAWFLGADYIERHITLDRTMYGTDQAASLSEAGIRELTSMLSKFPTMFGSGKKTISKEEKKLIPKFRYW